MGFMAHLYMTLTQHPYDTIWGVGLGEHHPDITDKSKWRGQNLLGKALMKVRDMLSTRSLS